MNENKNTIAEVSLNLLRCGWVILKLSVQALNLLLNGSHAKPRHSALKAQMLHEEGLISDEEYGKSVFR